MKINGDWLRDAEAQDVCDMLVSAGYKALFVGGCVRNALMNMPVADVDIATNALPDVVQQLCKERGLKSVPTGIEHGTVTVVVNGKPFEVTTFRKDVQTDGRRAVVAFAKTIKSDAKRRDFTVNALYAKPDGEVVDPLGGLDDVRQRRIRFIEDPETRIREDYLRILRFFRFFAYYGDMAKGIDPDGLAACAELSSGINNLSRERIGSEMRRLLSADDPRQSIAVMRQSGVLQVVLAGADDALLGPLIENERKVQAKPEPIRRLIALGGENPVDALRLSRKEAKRFVLLKSECGTDNTPAALGYRFGEDAAKDVLQLRAAQFNEYVRDKDLVAIRIGAAVEFPVTSTDLKPFYVGKSLGDQLKRLEQLWIDSEFQFSKEELLQKLS